MMFRLVKFATTLAGVALLLVSAGLDVNVRGQAQPGDTIDPALLAGFKWRSIGPDRGGRSIAVAGVKGRPREAYFGATGGGLWKTTDGGARWAPVTDGQIKSSSVGAVAVSESHPDIVFIGMGESCIRGNILPGDGVYKSVDAGKTWTHVGFRDSDAISQIRIHPTNPDIVFVADFGRYGKDSDERGVFKSTDGGKSWKKVLFRNAKTGRGRRRDRPQEPERDVRGDVGGLSRRVPDVERRPRQRPVQVDRRRRDLARDHPQPGPAAGARRQDQHRRLGRRLEPRLRARRKRKRRPLQLRRRRRDVEDGQRQAATSGSAPSITPMSTPIPSNKDIVYALNTSAFRSVDGGKTLTQHRRNGTHGDHHDLWIDPDDAQHVVLANDGGGAITYNVASPQRSWSGQGFPTEQFYHVITTKHAPFHVCGAQQDNSTLCIPSNNGIRGRGGGGGASRDTEAFYRRPAAASRATSRPIRRTSTSSTPARTTDRS